MYSSFPPSHHKNFQRITLFPRLHHKNSPCILQIPICATRILRVCRSSPLLFCTAIISDAYRSLHHAKSSCIPWIPSFAPPKNRLVPAFAPQEFSLCTAVSSFPPLHHKKFPRIYSAIFPHCTTRIAFLCTTRISRAFPLCGARIPLVYSSFPPNLHHKFHAYRSFPSPFAPQEFHLSTAVFQFRRFIAGLPFCKRITAPILQLSLFAP